MMNCLEIFIHLFYTLSVSSPLQIHFERCVGVRGKSNTNLECAFKIEDREEMIALILSAKNVTTATFTPIARFRLDKPSEILPGGRYLLDRVTLSNFTPLSTNATLTFQPLKCNDETEYQCAVSYFNDAEKTEESTNSTNLTVTVNPSMPRIVWNVSSVLEGDHIIFTCIGNVGKPPRTFIWKKHKGGTIYPYRNVTTESNTSDSCFYHGTSNLSIEVTAEDDNAVIRCSVNNSYVEEFYNETKPLDVKYKVRKPTLIRQPMEDEYLQGFGPIKLICIGRGNPQPSYTWLKDGNMDEILNSSNTLYITEVITNNSGVYRCNVSNSISGIDYTESTSVNITLVKERTTTSTTTTRTTYKESTQDANKEKGRDTTLVIWVVIGVVAVVIVVVIIGCIIYRQKRTGSGDEYAYVYPAN